MHQHPYQRQRPEEQQNPHADHCGEQRARSLFFHSVLSVPEYRFFR
ncbi:hypothetical protein RI056_03325 [Komagataeibacter nataicola]|nr:hypothetical protein [Komagataeibacter nataicola]WNM09095.1 hypothetical protein RI056_03325 [Komagataeibacter nataicola]